jgi:hypothetical protein
MAKTMRITSIQWVSIILHPYINVLHRCYSLLAARASTSLLNHIGDVSLSSDLSHVQIVVAVCSTHEMNQSPLPV